MNNYHLSIILKHDNKVEILLKKNVGALNCISWHDKQDLDKKLLKGIDKILKKSRIGISDVKKIEFLSEKETSFIARQIGQAIVNGTIFALKS